MKTIKMIVTTIFLLFFASFCVDESLISTPNELEKGKNILPVSNAGADQTITLPINVAKLDGTKSSDKDGKIAAWRWSKKSGPTQYALSTATSPQTDATDLVEGVYVFTLAITDNKDGAATDDVQITVLKGTTPPPSPTLTGFTPTSGVVGTTVTITGTNFASPTVSFNGTAATVTAATSTSITTTVPSGATTGTISVVSNGVTLNSASPFTVTTAPPPPPTTGEVYFSGDMSNVVLAKTSEGYKISSGWEDLKSQVDFVDMTENTSSPDYAYQEILLDPAGSGRKVMMGRLINDDPTLSGTSRAQMTMGLATKPGDIGVYHTTHRMYMHPDLKYIEQYPGVADWFSIFEIWNSHIDNMDGDAFGSARWGVSIHKDSPVGSPMYWVLYSEYMQPASLRYQDIWKYNNKTVQIPFGTWFTLDVYLKRGDASNGRVIVKITPDGGATTTLFDITGYTIYPDRPDLPLDYWTPFKLYIGDTYMDWMTGNGKYMAIYYNDYKWYKN